MSAVETEVGTRWVSDIAFEGFATDDGRWMEPGAISTRELPLTLMAQVETAPGHDGAGVAGRIDSFDRDSESDMDGEPLPEGVTALRSTGVFDDGGEFGAEIARLVENQTLRGVSVDLAVIEWGFRDPETGEIIDPEQASEEQWERAFMGELQFAILEGVVMAATVVPTPAFSESRIAVIASSYRERPSVWRDDEGQLMTTLYASITTGDDAWADSLTAAVAPLAPPTAWFNRPEASSPTPLTITANGEVYGHIALWNTCHTGFLNGAYSQCVRAPRTATSYAHFHVGEIQTEEGDLVPIGKLTVDTGHAPLSAGRVAARSHYDETGSVGAFVRAKDGQHGIWVSGAVRSDLKPELLRDMRANPPSGDWRSVDGSLELVAALSVPVPGFPVPRSQLALAASADGELEVVALILTAGAWYDEDDAEPNILESSEAVVLAAMIEGGGAALDSIIAGA